MTTTTKKKATAKKVAKKPAKKTARKTTAKKTTRKTTTTAAAQKSTKRISGKSLKQAKAVECFWVNEGPILKDLLELERALAAMSDEVFKRHVGGGRNDFAEWVEHVLMDAAAAADLRKTRKPQTAHKVVVQHLKLYQLPE